MVSESLGQPFESLICYRLKDIVLATKMVYFSLQYKSTGYLLVEINSVYHYVKDPVS